MALDFHEDFGAVVYRHADKERWVAKKLEEYKSSLCESGATKMHPLMNLYALVAAGIGASAAFIVCVSGFGLLFKHFTKAFAESFAGDCVMSLTFGALTIVGLIVFFLIFNSFIEVHEKNYVQPLLDQKSKELELQYDREHIFSNTD